MSLKIIQNGTIRKLGSGSLNSPSIVTMALFCISSEVKRSINRKSWCFSFGKKSKGFSVIVQVKRKGVWKIGVFRPIPGISLYFWNGTRYGHSYNGIRIRTRIWYIEWYHFQWSLVISNLDFNVTILFNVKILTSSQNSDRVTLCGGAKYRWA